MDKSEQDLRIYLDLEYCYPGMTRQSGRPTSDDLRQVVQIAAIKFDNEINKEISAFNRLVWPEFESNLPEFFTALTGISDDMLRGRAINFNEALDEFLDYIGDLQIFTFDKDWEVLKQNCGYINRVFPFANTPFARIKPKLAKWGLNPDKYSSGTLHKAAKIDIEGRPHDALHDVRSMATAVNYFENN